MTAVGTNRDTAGHVKERYSQVTKKVLTPSTHREENTVNWEEQERESESTSGTFPNVDSDLEKKPTVDPNRQKTGHGADRYCKVSEKASSPSTTHREESRTYSKEVKRETQSSHHTVPKKVTGDLSHNTNTRTVPLSVSPSVSPTKSVSTKPSTSPSTLLWTHREEVAVNFEEAKPQSETDTTRDTVTQVDSEIHKKTVVDTNNTETSGHVKERSNGGGEKGTQSAEAKPAIGHRVTRSGQETVTITEAEATDAQVCLNHAMVDHKMML